MIVGGKNMSNNIYQLVRNNIKFYRKQKNMTQNELSEITGFSHEYIRKLESSKYCGGLSLDSLYVISKALKVPISKFMESNYEV